MPDAPDPVTLDINCAHCGGAVTLQFDEWRSGPKPERETEQSWTCPYCLRANVGHFPGQLVWVTHRADGPEPGTQ